MSDAGHTADTRAAIRPSQHIGYVQVVQRGGFFAVCPTCGLLDYPNRATRGEVEHDLEDHVEERTAEYIRATDHLYRGRS